VIQESLREDLSQCLERLQHHYHLLGAIQTTTDLSHLAVHAYGSVRSLLTMEAYMLPERNVCPFQKADWIAEALTVGLVACLSIRLSVMTSLERE
jgi:hypothetical protein